MPYDSNEPEVGKAEEINAMARAAAMAAKGPGAAGPNEIRNPSPVGNPDGQTQAMPEPMDSGTLMP